MDNPNAVRRKGFEEYCAKGTLLVEDDKMFPWNFIKWYEEGQIYGEDQAQALSCVPDWSVTKLMNILAVGRLLKTRKYVGLVPFEHHRTVAKKYISKEDQEFLLGEAYKKKLTIVQLRRLQKGEKPREPLAVFEYHVRRAISSLNRALEAEKREPELIQTVITKLLELVEK
jgi:hypothetical protein